MLQMPFANLFEPPESYPIALRNLSMPLPLYYSAEVGPRHTLKAPSRTPHHLTPLELLLRPAHRRQQIAPDSSGDAPERHSNADTQARVQQFPTSTPPHHFLQIGVPYPNERLQL